VPVACSTTPASRDQGITGGHHENVITAIIKTVLETALEVPVYLPDDAEAEREAAQTPLNHTLQSALGEPLFLHHREMLELAV